MIWKGPSQIIYPNIFPAIDILNDVLGMKTAVLFTTKDVFLIGVTVPLMVILDPVHPEHQDGQGHAGHGPGSRGGGVHGHQRGER